MSLAVTNDICKQAQEIDTFWCQRTPFGLWPFRGQATAVVLCIYIKFLFINTYRDSLFTQQQHPRKMPWWLWPASGHRRFLPQAEGWLGVSPPSVFLASFRLLRSGVTYLFFLVSSEFPCPEFFKKPAPRCYHGCVGRLNQQHLSRTSFNGDLVLLLFCVLI